MTRYWVLPGSGFLGCHSQKLRKEQKKNTIEMMLRKDKEEKNNAWECMSM